MIKRFFDRMKKGSFGKEAAKTPDKGKGIQEPLSIVPSEVMSSNAATDQGIADREEQINVESSAETKDRFSGSFASGLNPEQMRAAAWNGSHALVLAGAGCGKTKTIISRAQYLIENVSPPERLQILTFTRRSASEIIERVKSGLGNKAQGLKASTFHTWCMSLIRRAPDLFGCDNSSVIDRDDQLTMFRLLRATSPEAKNALLPKAADLCDLYSFARNTRKSLRVTLEERHPESLEIFDSIAKIVTSYEDRKESRNYLDYDDILDVVAKQISQQDAVRKWVSSKYDEILVDEFQDTNPIQWDILKPISDSVRLFCVGDDAQSIYGFRGADFETIHSFGNRVDGATVLNLSTNYRSTQEILDISNWLLSESPLHYDKRLVAHRGSGRRPSLHTFSNEWQEGRWIADDLLRARSDGELWKDNMVLTRTAYASRALETCLIEKNIPYVFIGGRKLFEAAHVKDLLSTLRIVGNPKDELGWMRYLMLWEGVGETTASKAVSLLAEIVDINQALEAVSKSSRIPSRALEVIEQVASFGTVFECLKSSIRALTPVLENAYKTQNWDKRVRDFSILERLAHKHSSVLEFLEAYVLEPLYQDEVDGVDDDDVVTLITIHSAKGAECKRCYVINVSPGAYPSSRSMDSEKTVEEERRVLYVALTRAKDELMITRSGDFSASSSVTNGSDPYSRYFLSTLPETLADDEDTRLSDESPGKESIHKKKFSRPSTRIDIE
jgi:DNA helicase-2/ATP-dependent DNA helicase PcrA